MYITIYKKLIKSSRKALFLWYDNGKKWKMEGVMKPELLFILLSNSKYAGQTTCDVMPYANRYLSFLKLNPLSYTRAKMMNLKKIVDDGDVLHMLSIMREMEIRLCEDVLPNIFRAPKYLYVMGKKDMDLMALKKTVSIVGARECSVYGARVAYKLGYEFAERGYTVVSGLAYGVDIKAHRGALAAGGATVAVLGSGILNCYPKQHQKDYEIIKENGIIVSEYGLYGKPLKHHFPFRNRLISGLSDFLIVVEARESSGTMITVQYALDQGKSVYAVPGSVFSEQSQGTHQLIKEGAEIVTSIEKLMSEIINFK